MVEFSLAMSTNTRFHIIVGVVGELWFFRSGLVRRNNGRQEALRNDAGTF
jgi:hypothetical protein